MIEMFSGCVIIEYHLGYIVLEFRACSLPRKFIEVHACNNQLREPSQLYNLRQSPLVSMCMVKWL